jgi:hypothetical protein
VKMGPDTREQPMRICVCGLGYVGAVTAACLARLRHVVMRRHSRWHSRDDESRLCASGVPHQWCFASRGGWRVRVGHDRTEMIGWLADGHTAVNLDCSQVPAACHR